MGRPDGSVLIVTGGGHGICRATLWRMIRWTADELDHRARSGQRLGVAEVSEAVRGLYGMAPRGIVATRSPRL